MISKAKAKFIKSLQVKKYRKQEQCFIVEGAKGIGELLTSDFEILWLAGTKKFVVDHHALIAKAGCEVVEAMESEIEALGSFQSNNAGLAIAKMKPNKKLVLSSEYVIVLDDIRDPGNLGTIIRTADWYGISKIIASEETADFYNPKVISSTMGSFCRVEIFYTHLPSFLQGSKMPLYGASLHGSSIYEENFGDEGFILIGNESLGLSREVDQFVSRHITIPRRGLAESLNASVATAIILDNVFRSKK